MTGAPRALRRIAAIVVACSLVVACSSAQEGPKTSATPQAKQTPKTTQTADPTAPSPAPTSKGTVIDISVHDLQVGDYLKHWASPIVGEFNAYAPEWGVDRVYAPKEDVSRYIEGIAPFGNHCIVLFGHVRGRDDGTETLSLLTVASRYNNLVVATRRDISFPDGINSVIAFWLDPCESGKYTPMGKGGDTTASATA